MQRRIIGARELGKLGHRVKLIPPAYAKAYVRRNKNDAADAAAICEAVSRPSMRFVEIKSEAQQAAAGIHKVREMLMKQRTMLINALRGLMAEFGIVVGAGTRHVGELTAILADPEEQRIPALLKDGLRRMAEVLRALERQLEGIDKSAGPTAGRTRTIHASAQLGTTGKLPEPGGFPVVLPPVLFSAPLLGSEPPGAV